MRENPILYVVLNKELNMSAGKAAAQAVHAAMMLQGVAGSNQFADNYRRTVVVLEAENSEQIRNLHEYLKSARIYSQYYIDEGVNEISAYSITALAVVPFDASDEQKREIFAPFNLFGYEDNDDYDDCNTVSPYKPDSQELQTLKRIEYTVGLVKSQVTPVPKTKRPNFLKRLLMRGYRDFVS